MRPRLDHPLWVGSLLLLLVNDHALKGAGLLPDLITGKLSDLAGLIVAPALLASLLPAGRTGRLAAHLAVGGVFAGLQLAPGFAAGWDAALAAVGVPWTTVSDPTDLIALPALLASWWVLRPDPRARPTPWLRAVGFVACVATSPSEPRTPGTWTPSTPPTLDHQVALVNDGPDTLTVLVRPLRPGVEIDCDQLEVEVPGELLSDALFDVAVEWEVPPLRGIPALADPFATLPACHAVLLDGPELEPHVLFWRSRQPVWSLADPTDPQGFAVSLVTFDDLDRGLVTPWAPRFDPECVAPSELDRVDWSVPGSGSFTLTAITVGPDGCLGLDTESDLTLYLCMPEAAFPFEIGDTVEVDDDGDVLHVDSVDRSLTLAHPTTPDSLIAGVRLRIDPAVGCGWRVDPTCGHVTGDVGVDVTAAGDAPVSVEPGGPPVTVELVDGLHDVWVTRAERRAVSVTDCGRPVDLYDVDVIVTTTPEL